jgi:hypothetical protein
MRPVASVIEWGSTPTDRSIAAPFCRTDILSVASLSKASPALQPVSRSASQPASHPDSQTATEPSTVAVAVTGATGRVGSGWQLRTAASGTTGLAFATAASHEYSLRAAALPKAALNAERRANVAHLTKAERPGEPLASTTVHAFAAARYWQRPTCYRALKRSDLEKLLKKAAKPARAK